MKAKQKSSAMKMAALSILYMAVTVGMLAVFVIPYGQLPDYFGINYTQLGLAVTGCSIVSILGLSIAPKVLAKIQTKGCMLLGAGFILAYGFVTAYVRNFFGCFLGFALLGGVCAFSLYVMNTAFISTWFVEKRATMISICIGAGLIGTGLMQFAAGQLLASLGVANLLLFFSIGVCVIQVICALLVKNSPQDVGELPYGAKEEAGAEQAAAKTPEELAAEKEAAKAASKAAKRKLYKSPTFWLIMAAMVFGGGMQIAFVTSYMTAYFPTLGMDIATASTLVSVMGLLAGGANMIGGRVMEKIGMRPYVSILMIAAAASNFLMYLYGGSQSVIFLVGIVITYAIGYVGYTVCNVLVGPLFGEKLATEVNSKLLIVSYAVNLVNGTVFGAVVDNCGFRTLYLITTGIGLIALFLYTLVFASAKKMKLND